MLLPLLMNLQAAAAEEEAATTTRIPRPRMTPERRLMARLAGKEMRERIFNPWRGGPSGRRRGR